jgi:hypothetical protein
MLRKYTDVHGNARVLEWKEDVEGLVGYRRTLDGIVYSGASRWYTEDGSVIQLPEDAFEHCNIKYTEEYIYD